MKLRMANRSFNGGPSPKNDEFFWVIGPRREGQQLLSDGYAEPIELVFACRGGRFANCIVRVTMGEASPPRWHWDGNIQEPTLSPSIGCDSRCGWHGHIIKGEITP